MVLRFRTHTETLGAYFKKPFALPVTPVISARSSVKVRDDSPSLESASAATVLVKADRPLLMTSSVVGVEKSGSLASSWLRSTGSGRYVGVDDLEMRTGESVAVGVVEWVTGWVSVRVMEVDGEVVRVVDEVGEEVTAGEDVRVVVLVGGRVNECSLEWVCEMVVVTGSEWDCVTRCEWVVVVDADAVSKRVSVAVAVWVGTLEGVAVTGEVAVFERVLVMAREGDVETVGVKHTSVDRANDSIIAAV